MLTQQSRLLVLLDLHCMDVPTQLHLRQWQIQHYRVGSSECHPTEQENICYHHNKTRCMSGDCVGHLFEVFPPMGWGFIHWVDVLHKMSASKHSTAFTCCRCIERRWITGYNVFHTKTGMKTLNVSPETSRIKICFRWYSLTRTLYVQV